MSKRYILAHDLGTSGNKACLFEEDGTFCGSAFCAYDTFFPQPKYAEQSPEAWWNAVKLSSRQILHQEGTHPEDVTAISFSAQSSGCLPVDRAGNPLRENALIWMDSRSEKQAAYLEKQLGPRTQYEITGNGLGTVMLPCSKIMWMRENEPDIYQKAFKFIGCKEYIIGRLTGEIGCTDYSEAQTSGLFSAVMRDYDPRLMAAAEIPRAKLCDPMDSTCVVGTVRSDVAPELGVSPRTKVVLGMMDNPSVAIGAGCMTPGVFVASLGTAAWLGSVASHPVFNGDYRVNSTYVGFGRYRSSVNSHTAGAAFSWAVENLLGFESGSIPHDQLEMLARDVSPGAGGMFFLPSFRGGNCRYSNPNVGGVLAGLKLDHGKKNIARALYEGTAYDVMIGMEFFTSEGLHPKEIRIVGGGSKSALQRQIVADVFGVAVTTPQNFRHMGAAGAAALARVGIGLLKDLESAADGFTAADRCYPNPEHTKVYRQLYPIYKKFYEALLPVYDAFAAL